MRVIRAFTGLVIAVISTQVFAQERSISIGVHTQGIMLNFVQTGENRFGFFLGGAWNSRKDEDLPTEANFSWINYSNEDWKSKDAYYGELAFRVDENFTLGIGYGQTSTEYYR